MSLGDALSVVSRYTVTEGLLYTFGLLIVNADLAFFGLVSLDLARADYILAGALWGFISVVIPLSGIHIALFLRTRRTPSFKLLIARIDAFILFGAVLPLLVIELLASSGDTPRDVRDIRHSPALPDGIATPAHRCGQQLRNHAARWICRACHSRSRAKRSWSKHTSHTSLVT
jgi:hypothetical protein